MARACARVCLGAKSHVCLCVRVCARACVGPVGACGAGLAKRWHVTAVASLQKLACTLVMPVLHMWPCASARTLVLAAPHVRAGLCAPFSCKHTFSCAPFSCLPSNSSTQNMYSSPAAGHFYTTASVAAPAGAHAPVQAYARRPCACACITPDASYAHSVAQRRAASSVCAHQGAIIALHL